ncbi:tetratricopeptide repeat protein [Candidatus Poribacteria bacterium]|nr:tetratricopeptide repeat protein [Candidatus Poribacteria bacterium]
MSVVHAPLSFYTHGLILKPFKFSNDTAKLRWARATMLVYTLALAGVVYVWAKKLFGAWGGLTALAMYCFNSNIIAHSSLLTTDVIYAFFSLSLLYSYWRYTMQYRTRWLVASGISLGLALLSKYPAVLWFFLLPVIAGTLLITEARSGETDDKSLLRRVIGTVGAVAAIFLLAILVINIGYGFSGTFSRLGSNHYQSHSLAMLSENPLTSRIPIPLPYPFLIGYDVQKTISEVGHPTFLAGMRSTRGWWYYYLACFFLKMPAAFWPILIWACVGIFSPNKPASVSLNRGHHAAWCPRLRLFLPQSTTPPAWSAAQRAKNQRNAKVMLILSFAALTTASSFLSRSQAGFRYVLMTLPPLFILSGSVAQNVGNGLRRFALAALLCLYMASALMVHPHHIAYFSAFVGGPENGYKWLSDSNLDWGQDLERARDYVRKSNVPITVNPGIMPVSDRILINATTLQDTFVTYDIHGWLRGFKPIDYIGYSWLVFDITEETLKDRVLVPDALPENYYRGAFEYERDHLREASRLAASLLTESPALPEALYLGGLCEMGLGKLDEAEEIFGKIPMSHALYVEARNNMSFLAAVRGNSEASKTYRKQSMLEDTLRAYARRPALITDESPDASALTSAGWRLLNNIGVSEWSRGMPREAEKSIRSALAIQPNFVEAYANLAVVLEDQGRFDEALRALDEYEANMLLLRTTPYRDYRVYYQDTRVMMGDTLELFPKPDPQVLRLESHLARFPADVPAMNQFAVALMKQGRFGEAFETLRRGLADYPRSSALHTTLAVLYTEKRMFSQALSACEQAVRIDPGNASAAELLLSIQKKLAESVSS